MKLFRGGKEVADFKGHQRNIEKFREFLKENSQAYQEYLASSASTKIEEL
jgi:hypothetical protein